MRDWQSIQGFPLPATAKPENRSSIITASDWVPFKHCIKPVQPWKTLPSATIAQVLAMQAVATRLPAVMAELIGGDCGGLGGPHWLCIGQSVSAASRLFRVDHQSAPADPAFVLLAGDKRLGRFALGVEGVEFEIEALFAQLPRV
jgi:hypothetical protein